MNHLEQLVAEWLQYKGYYVRVSVPVGPLQRGGYEGELDVVAVNFACQHLLHVECSLDADSDEKRQKKFGLKFDRGRRHINSVFSGIPLPDKVEQIVVLQFASGQIRDYGGARLVLVPELIHEIYAGLKGTSPGSKAVSSNLPLLRTLQLAADAGTFTPSSDDHRLLRPVPDQVMGA